MTIREILVSHYIRQYFKVLLFSISLPLISHRKNARTLQENRLKMTVKITVFKIHVFTSEG